jgi:hypothetical protein
MLPALASLSEREQGERTMPDKWDIRDQYGFKLGEVHEQIDPAKSLERGLTKASGAAGAGAGWMIATYPKFSLFIILGILAVIGACVLQSELSRNALISSKNADILKQPTTVSGISVAPYSAHKRSGEVGTHQLNPDDGAGSTFRGILIRDVHLITGTNATGTARFKPTVRYQEDCPDSQRVTGPVEAAFPSAGKFDGYHGADIGILLPPTNSSPTWCGKFKNLEIIDLGVY